MKPMPKSAYWLVPLFPIIGIVYALYFVCKVLVALAVMIYCHMFKWEQPEWLNKMMD